jgi:signal transduction histidine kinase/CheY-like chemotaxis protein
VADTVTEAPGSDSSPPVRESRFRLRVLIVSFLVAVLVVGETALDVYRDHTRLTEDAERQVENLVVNLASTHKQVFDSINLLFFSLEDHLNETDTLDAGGRAHIGRLLRAFRSRSPEFQNVVVLDRDEIVVASGRRASSGEVLFFDPRRIKTLIEGNDLGKYIEAPVTTGSSANLVIPVVRAFRNRSGQVAYAAVVTLKPSALTGTHSALEIGSGSVMLLARTDGIVLARSPSTDIVGGSLAGRPLFTEHIPSASTGAYTSPPQSDGEIRIVGYHVIPEHKLVTAIAIDRDKTLAPWRENLIGHIGSAILLVLLAAAAAWFTIRSHDREAALRRSAERARNRARDRAVKQQIMAGLSQYSAEAEDSQDFLDRAARALRKGTDCDFASIARQVSSGSQMMIVARDGWPEHAREEYVFVGGTDSHLGFALHSRDTIISDDYGTEKRFRPHHRLVELGARSGVAVPMLTASGGFSGALSVYSTRPAAFSDDDRMFVEAIGHLIASYYERRIQSNLRSAVLDSVPSMLAVLDHRGDILFVNRSWISEGDARDLQMPEGGVGANYIDICTRAAAEGVVEARQMQEGILDVMSGQTDRFQMEYPCGDEKEMRWFFATVSPVNLDGHSGALVSHLDITSRRELEKQLREASRMEALGQLTGGIAHDFNNLLMVVAGNAEMLSDRIGSETKEGRMLAAIREASGRGAALTDGLLSFSRRQLLSPQAVEPQKVLLDVARLLERTLREDIELKVETPDFCHQILADEAQLHTALMNLVLNARDALPNGGTIILRCEDLDNRADPVAFVRLSVSDNGEGMSVSAAEKAFEPFFTTKPVGQGTGLGLSMVHGFAIQSGGRAHLESKPGQGTRVMIELPVATGSEADGNNGGAADLEDQFEGTILVVEDEDRVRNYLRLLLEDIGLTVHEASSAVEALDLLKELPALDILLSDVIMPGSMSGYGLAREIRRERPNCGIILMSGYTDPSMIERLHEHDPSIPLLRKPFSRGQLVAMLKTVLSD